MSDIYGSHFEFGGISSRKYNLMIATVESSRFTKTSGDISANTIFSRLSKKNYLLDTDYSGSPLSFEVEILTDDDSVLEFGTRRDIEKWLFNKHNYRRLYIDIADDPLAEMYSFVDGVQKRLYFNCRLINPEKLEYRGGIVGYKCTLETDSMMLWQDAVISEFDIDNEDSESTSLFTVNVDTDIDDYTYPIVTITIGTEGGDIVITNNTDDSSRLTKFVGLSPNSTVKMNGEINQISDQNYLKFVYRNFIRLLDGENNFTVIGNVSKIKVEFQNRRML